MKKLVGAFQSRTEVVAVPQPQASPVLEVVPNRRFCKTFNTGIPLLHLVRENPINLPIAYNPGPAAYFKDVFVETDTPSQAKGKTAVANINIPA